MKEMSDKEMMTGLLDLLRDTRAEQRVTSMMTAQVMMRLAIMSENPRGFCATVMDNIERDLKTLAGMVPAEDDLTREEIIESHKYLGEIRKVINKSMNAAIEIGN